MRFHDVQRIQFQGKDMVLLVDGTEYRVDVRSASKRLAQAADSARRHFSISPSGYGIHWSEIDEDLSASGLIAMSNQSQTGIEKTAFSSRDAASNPSGVLLEHLRRVIGHVETTSGRFRKLTECGLKTMPIPYFGDLEQAEIVTVGLNPLDDEFEASRNWPAFSATADYLESRLRNYFRPSSPRRHPWFVPWEECLQMLNGSAYQNQAVHLDLCPRSPIPARKLPTDEFLEMVMADLPFFVETLHLCHRARVILIAGTVTNRFWMNRFLQKHVSGFSRVLEGSIRRPESGGWSCRHELFFEGKEFHLPVFFFSSGPSSPIRGRLKSLVSDRRDEIYTCLNNL
jgi:hypothetical protein